MMKFIRNQLIGKIIIYITNIFTGAIHISMDLLEQLYSKTRRKSKMSEKKEKKKKEVDIDMNELAEVVADLVIELRVLETKVERLCEFRDTLGHVPIYENGGKQ